MFAPIASASDETAMIVNPRLLRSTRAANTWRFWNKRGFSPGGFVAPNPPTGAVIDYGVEPEQPHAYYSLRDIKSTLQTTLAAAGKLGGQEAAIWHGLDRLTARLLARAWKREDGTESRQSELRPCGVTPGWP